MYHSINLVGYYWPRIMADCVKIVDNFKHLPPVPLHPMVLSWPFDAWLIDVVSAIEPLSTRGTTLSSP
jgi:hypothetical protein